jgi:hypothetical protein
MPCPEEMMGTSREHELALLLALMGCWLLPAAPAAAEEYARVDVAASVGDWFHLDARDFPVPGFRPEFFGALAAQVSGGYCWNEHLKSEIELGWTGSKRNKYGDDTTSVTHHLIRHYRFSRTSLAQLYQFRRDARLHPFIGVGVGIDAESKRDGKIHYVPTGSGSFDEVEVPPIPSWNTRRVAHAFGKVGLKADTWEHMFFITELKIGRQVGRTLKLGMGVDF